jgi:hypothetical protein
LKGVSVSDDPLKVIEGVLRVIADSDGKTRTFKRREHIENEATVKIAGHVLAQGGGEPCLNLAPFGIPYEKENTLIVQ